MGNLNDTAMKTITVKKDRLVKTLNENLEIHRREFGEATKGFRDAQNRAIRVLNDATEHGRGNIQKVHEAYRDLNNLDVPQDYSTDYERAIGLMDWEVEDTVKLSVSDFENYVQDNWNWKRGFKMSHSNYSGGC